MKNRSKYMTFGPKKYHFLKYKINYKNANVPMGGVGFLLNSFMISK